MRGEKLGLPLATKAIRSDDFIVVAMMPSLAGRAGKRADSCGPRATSLPNCGKA